MSRLKVSMAVDKTDLTTVISALAGMEGLQLTVLGEQRDRTESEVTQWHDLEERISGLHQRLHNLSVKLGIPLAHENQKSEQPEGTRKPAEEPAGSLQETAERIERETEEIENRFEKLEEKKKNIDEQLLRLRTATGNRQILKDAGIDAPAADSLNFLHLELGWIPSDQIDRIDIRVIRTPVVILPFHLSGGKMFIASATLRKNAYILRRILDSLFFEPVEHLRISGQETENIRERIKDLENNFREIEESRARMVEKWKVRLAKMYQEAGNALSFTRMVRTYGRPGNKYLFTGFVTEDRLSRLNSLIRENSESPFTVLAGKSEEAD